MVRLMLQANAPDREVDDLVSLVHAREPGLPVTLDLSLVLAVYLAASVVTASDQDMVPVETTKILGNVRRAMPRKIPEMIHRVGRSDPVVVPLDQRFIHRLHVRERSSRVLDNLRVIVVFVRREEDHPGPLPSTLSKMSSGVVASGVSNSA